MEKKFLLRCWIGGHATVLFQSMMCSHILHAGKDEGAFAWLTLNYLLGKLGKGADATVAAVDLGGGSVQEAFALSDSDAATAPAGYVTKLKASGGTYNVYVHRYDCVPKCF